MRFAYADPPYLGEAVRLYGDLHPEAAEYDRPEKHAELIAALDTDYDGWGLSLHVPSLRAILPMCPDDVRVCAWVKPFVSFKPSVRQAYAWEPVIVKPLRRVSDGSGAPSRTMCRRTSRSRRDSPEPSPSRSAIGYSTSLASILTMSSWMCSPGRVESCGRGRRGVDNLRSSSLSHPSRISWSGRRNMAACHDGRG